MVSHQGQSTCYGSGAVQIPMRPKNTVQMARKESANCSPAVGRLGPSAFKSIQHIILHIHWFSQVATILRRPLLNEGVHLGVMLRWLRAQTFLHLCNIMHFFQEGWRSPREKTTQPAETDYSIALEMTKISGVRDIQINRGSTRHQCPNHLLKRSSLITSC